MSNLQAAHRGYGYQDLLIASRLVDLVLGSLVDAQVDLKLFEGDRFDDLTTTDPEGNRERTQFKHTTNDDRPLTLRTFTSDDRGLQLDAVFESMLADRAGPGCTALSALFRVVLRDQPATDPRLTAVLKNVDVRPFLPTSNTTRLCFDPTALWIQRNDPTNAENTFSFLFSGERSISFEDLEWVCHRLTIEVGAPRFSGDLTAPDEAEVLLLTRVRDEVGAESPPNSERGAADVAQAFISTVQSARQGMLSVTGEGLLRRARLRSDFGAVLRANPVDRSIEVPRANTVRRLIETANAKAARGGYMLIVGAPGQGKSWVCQQLLETLIADGWLTAEHYCYLGEADGERSERVLSETIFGSLVARLAEADPDLVKEQRPRFAADEQTLIDCLRRSLDSIPDRRIALVIDGIDHITRVRAGDNAVGGFDPTKSLAETLSLLDLPQGVVVVVLSQPGRHLDPFRDVEAQTVEVPRLGEGELRQLAMHLNVVPSDEPTSSLSLSATILDAELVSNFLTALDERSSGNALYATYICRETLRDGHNYADPSTLVRSLPQFDGTLRSYYDHLCQSLSSEGGWVADVIALIDFAVSRGDLREIRPDAAHRVDRALNVLAPVVVEVATQGGVRIYHESFARYLRTQFIADASALTALLDRVANWLESKGLFSDPRSFHSLLSLLAEAGHDTKVLDLVDREFVTRAVAAGYSTSSINANLVIAIGSAARLFDWPRIVRYVELARAADSYQHDVFVSTLIAFADVPAALLGADTVAARLIDDGRPTMPARAGLQMCAAVDALGAAAPWRTFMDRFLRENEIDNTSYGVDSDRAVALAWLRGQLRTSSQGLPASDGDKGGPLDSPGTPTDTADAASAISGGGETHVDWFRLGHWIENAKLPSEQVVRAIEDTIGLQDLARLSDALPANGAFCLAVAQRLASMIAYDGSIDSPRSWALKAVQLGVPFGSAHTLLKLGVNLELITNDSPQIAREALLNLTRLVQESSVRWEEGRIGEWMDACTIAARQDPLGLSTAEALIIGEGWYRCWLRFTIALTRAEAAESPDHSSKSLEALTLLLGDLNPFSGDPRACDLYPLHNAISETINRAMQLLDEEHWIEGLNLLRDVSAPLTTSVQGQLSGPVPTELLLQIATESASSVGRVAAEMIVQDEMTNHSANRFYADLAEYQLHAARLALAARDRPRAEELWQQACKLLIAYGWHKDITIFELLDPFPALINADRMRARARLEGLQGLCERVPLHTDLKETRHAWSRWWTLLALADPVAAVELVAKQSLSECNDPHELLSGAMEDVWNEWHEDVNPTLSGLLRLTLDSPLTQADAMQLKLLADGSGGSEESTRDLMTWLLARADERPISYSVTNSPELIANDDEVLAGINEIAGIVDLPKVLAVSDATEEIDESESSAPDRAGRRPIRTTGNTEYDGFPPGSLGIARAIRVWRSRPYESLEPEWNTDRFANVIGYRLLELLSEARQQEASSTLQSLADASGLGDRGGILRAIAEGLDRHGANELAAIAYTFVWTRARSGGGWLTFGGTENIDALERASVLAPNISHRIVADEIAQAVTNPRFGTYGISQAVIHALTVGAVGCPGMSASESAFSTWDEAYAVISERAPRVDTSDDPEHPYISDSNAGSRAIPNNLETAFALATLTSLGDASREKKRRTLIAAQMLLNGYPDVAAPAFNYALRTISDPATLTWLLRLIEHATAGNGRVNHYCQETLRDLAQRDHLTVRALARRLLTGDEPPIPRPTPADQALLDGFDRTILIASGDNAHARDATPGLDELITSAAGERLWRGEEILPGLTEALRSRVAIMMAEEGTKKRLRRQLRSFALGQRSRPPDAFLAYEQGVEECLQLAAAGGREARLIAGEPIVDPIDWEDGLASAILDDPIAAIALESTRQPRPLLAPPPTRGSNIWTGVRSLANGGAEGSIESALERGGLLFSTLRMESVDALPLPQVDHASFAGWRWLATIEQRWIKQPRSQNDGTLLSERYRAVEIRNQHDRQALDRMPLMSGDSRTWENETGFTQERASLELTQPLIGVYEAPLTQNNGRHGLGFPGSLLTPTIPLATLLGLRPSSLFSLEDDNGIGLALVVWRAEYDTSEYYLAWPRIVGCGIAIRPDLLARLVSLIGEDRIISRDFVIGDSDLATE